MTSARSDVSDLPRSHGEGPGARTRDGCSVDLYLRLPYRGEVELFEPWIPGIDVLELGCGVGRLTKHLLARGYHVTGVDNSPEMLAHVPKEATRICANVEELALDAEFDAVILASSLINTPSATQRSALLAACHRHLRPGARLFFERYDPAWLSTAKVGPLGTIGDVEMHIDRLVRRLDHVEISLRYRARTEEWMHHFVAASLGNGQIRECLAEAKFDEPVWIDSRWGFAARTASARLQRG